MNTDNSWMEVSAAAVHDNQNAMSSDFKVTTCALKFSFAITSGVTTAPATPAMWGGGGGEWWAAITDYLLTNHLVRADVKHTI